MCNLASVLGEGDILFLQALTAISIAASIAAWVLVYTKNGLKDALVLYALPIALWTLFGSLDILITAKGTFLNPYREGNQLARAVFIEAGYLGPVAASILWIALWAFIVFAINKLKMPNARFVSLCIFYSLSMGHLSGFSSWYAPFCQIARTVAWSKLPIIIGLGIIAACLHLAAQKAIDGGVGARKKN